MMFDEYTVDELGTHLAQCGIPSHMHHSIIKYILDGVPVGHFLTAILSNDLKEACARGDEDNIHKLYEYVFFLHNYAPGGCWGSKANLQSWLEHRGLNGLYVQESNSSR